MKLYEVLGFVDDPQTGMPTYDNMLQNPDYFARAKRRKHGVVLMSPDEYIQKAFRGFEKMNDHNKLSIEDVISSRDPKRVKKYAQQMQSGEKFPTIVLDYSLGFSQEGLHRALAAKILGIEEIPVMIVSLTRNKERKGRGASY